MTSKFVEDYSMIILIYEIKEHKTIKIFDFDFVKKNKIYCKMIINNKIYALTDIFRVVDKNIKLLKIKLLILNNKKINLSFMLYECISLKEFCLISEEEKITTKEFQDINRTNKSDIKVSDLNDKLKNRLNEYSSIDINNINDKEIIINNMNNYSSKNNEKEKINFINGLSDEFSYTPHSSIKSSDNNIIEYSSFYKNSFSFKSLKIKGLNINKYLYKNSKKNIIIAKDLGYMFYGCSSLLSITGLSKIKTSNIPNMDHIFENCSLEK